MSTHDTNIFANPATTADGVGNIDATNITATGLTPDTPGVLPCDRDWETLSV